MRLPSIHMITMKHLQLLLPVVIAGSLVSCGPKNVDTFEGLYKSPPEVAAREPASRNDRPIRAQTGPLHLTLDDAILMALENNQALVVEQYHREIRSTFGDEEEAVFDPRIAAEVSGQRIKSERQTLGGTEDTTVDTGAGRVSIEKLLPSGTNIALSGRTLLTDSSAFDDDHARSTLGLTVTQALLRGFGSDVNMASVRQAQLNATASEYEFRAFAEALIAQVEETCWDYALAKRQMEIFSESLRLAEQQRDETSERIAVGRVAETELAAAQAEVALRREALINARSNLASLRLKLVRLLSPGEDAWGREILFEALPELPEKVLDDEEDHVQLALQVRPDLNHARIGVERGELEIVKTRNGLLPRMDLFVTLGGTGYAESFGQSLSGGDGSGYEATIGARFEYALGNRAASARHQRALLNREQALAAVTNLESLVQVDVRVAYLEVQRTAEQVSATEATRRFQEEKVRVEAEKFRVGRSTSLLVASAQRDLLASQISEVQAITNHLKALISLYRLDGSLLQRRGIAMFGDQPIIPLRSGQ